MNRRSISFGVAALAGAALVAGAVAPASADFAPQAKDIVGVGSDTTQFAINNAADGAVISGVLYDGYNSGAAGGRLVSFNATSPVGATDNTIVLQVGTTPITRPDGSGKGKALLYTDSTVPAVNNPNVDFARSSSGPSTAEVNGGLYFFPFARDIIGVATATTSYAPASLTGLQIVGIYEGTYTNWSQVGGANQPIVAYIPQTGSGTGKDFKGQLDALKGSAVTIAASVLAAQEHDPSVLAGNPNAIAPFSAGRARVFAPTTIKMEQGWQYLRAVYNVVRGTDLAKPWVAALFGTNGFFCSTGGRDLVYAGGLDQLALPLDGGVCGQSRQTAVPVAGLLLS